MDSQRTDPPYPGDAYPLGFCDVAESDVTMVKIVTTPSPSFFVYAQLFESDAPVSYKSDFYYFDDDHPDQFSPETFRLLQHNTFYNSLQKACLLTNLKRQKLSRAMLYGDEDDFWAKYRQKNGFQENAESTIMRLIMQSAVKELFPHMQLLSKEGRLHISSELGYIVIAIHGDLTRRQEKSIRAECEGPDNYMLFALLHDCMGIQLRLSLRPIARNPRYKFLCAVQPKMNVVQVDAQSDVSLTQITIWETEFKPFYKEVSRACSQFLNFLTKCIYNSPDTLFMVRYMHPCGGGLNLKSQKYASCSDIGLLRNKLRNNSEWKEVNERFVSTSRLPFFLVVSRSGILHERLVDECRRDLSLMGMGLALFPRCGVINLRHSITHGATRIDKKNGLATCPGFR